MCTYYVYIYTYLAKKIYSNSSTTNTTQHPNQKFISKDKIVIIIISSSPPFTIYILSNPSICLSLAIHLTDKKACIHHTYTLCTYNPYNNNTHTCNAFKDSKTFALLMMMLIADASILKVIQTNRHTFSFKTRQPSFNVPLLVFPTQQPMLSDDDDEYNSHWKWIYIGL